MTGRLSDSCTVDLPCAGSIGSMHGLGQLLGIFPPPLPHNPYLGKEDVMREYKDAPNQKIPIKLENVLPAFDGIAETVLPHNLYLSGVDLNRVYKDEHDLTNEVSGFGREPDPFVRDLLGLEVDVPLLAHDEYPDGLDTYGVCTDAHGFDYQNDFGNVGEAIPPPPPPPVHSHRQHTISASTRLPPLPQHHHHHTTTIASTQPTAAAVPMAPVKLETKQTSYSQYSAWALFAYSQTLLARSG